MKRLDQGGYKDSFSEERFKEEDAYLRAKKKLEKLVGFYWHLAVYVVVNLFLIILIGTNSGDGFWNFGTFATPFFWGIGLLFHFLGVFGPSFIFGQNWEEKKIRKFMDNDKQEWK